VLSARIAAVSIVALAAAALATVSPRSARADATGASLGTATATNYGACAGRPSSSGDTWYNTWADDGHVYATSDDSSGFAGSCGGSPATFHGACQGGFNSNLVVNELDGPDPEHLTSPYQNCMTSYGYAGDQGDQAHCPDGATWKTGGVLSVGGTLYVVVSRQRDAGNQYPNGYQLTQDATIIESTDHGRHWTSPWSSGDPNGAAPPCNPATGHYDAMFSGSRFATVFFVNYGRDDVVSSAADGNGGDAYVYAMANDGYAYNGSSAILGRVPRGLIASLDASAWQFYRNAGFSGGSGSDARNWTGSVGAATPVLTASHRLSQASVQYVPGLRRYVMTSFFYNRFDQCWPWVFSSQNASCSGADEARQTTLSFYQAPAPWGPWTQFFSQDTSGLATPGLYDPTLVSKFVRADGLSQTLFSSGDFVLPFLSSSATTYSLHTFPLAMTSDGAAIADDAGAGFTYRGAWVAGTSPGYFHDGTLHASSTPGDSVSFTFSGTFVAWIGATNADHGHAAVSIDGGQAADVDTFAPQWSRQAILYERTNLSSGTHTVTVTVTGARDASATGTYQDVDAFEFGATAPPVAGVDDAAAGGFGANWTSLVNLNYFDGTLHADCSPSGGPDDAATYTFIGPSIRWTGASNHDHGYASVSIDGGPPFAVDTYSPQWGYRDVLLERTGLADGPHTITISAAAVRVGSSTGYCQDVDALGD